MKKQAFITIVSFLILSLFVSCGGTDDDFSLVVKWTSKQAETLEKNNFSSDPIIDSLGSLKASGYDIDINNIQSYQVTRSIEFNDNNVFIWLNTYTGTAGSETVIVKGRLIGRYSGNPLAEGKVSAIMQTATRYDDYTTNSINLPLTSFGNIEFTISDSDNDGTLSLVDSKFNTTFIK